MFSLNLDPMAGFTIIECIKKALELTEKFGMVITFNFNGVHMTIGGARSIEEYEEEYFNGLRYHDE